MLQDPKAYIEHLEDTCRAYRASMDKGEAWASIPCEIAEHWLSLLRRSDVTAAEAANLVRRCDEHQTSKGGVAFFTMCNTIRARYRDTYERELRETL
jgi:hypothetical protein